MKPLRDKAVELKKGISILNESLAFIERKKKEDSQHQRQNEKDVKTISRELEKVDMNNDIQTIDDALVQMMNYELYQRAIDYKQRESDDKKKKLIDDQDAALQKKIDEKLDVIYSLKEENKKMAEQLGKTSEAAEELAQACAGKLENLPLYRNNLEYFDKRFNE